MRKSFGFICIFLLVFSFVFVGFSKSADFDLVPSFTISNSKYFVVEFSDLIYEDDKNTLKNVGVEFVNYRGNNSFLTKFDKGLISKLSDFSFVKSVKRYKKPKIKSKSFEQVSVMSLDNIESPELFKVELFDKSISNLFENEILKLDGEIISSENERFLILIDESKVSLLEEYNKFEEVNFISKYSYPQILNVNSKSTINVYNYFSDYGLFGEGQIVAVADTGLDIGVVNSSFHPDFLNKSVTIIELVGSDGSSDLSSGHGTHVAGSVLGNGVLSGANLSSDEYVGSNSGMAPKSDLYFQALEYWTGSFYGLGVPINLDTGMFQPSYSFGARIHSNSWGDPTTLGDYSSDSVDVDLFTWNNKDMIILFAAGNCGTTNSDCEYIGANSVLPPGTSKNAITVGASSGDVSIASFSSKGPTDDGRIKPDIVAPGVSITSTRSRLSTTGSGDYTSKSGTSMATPTTAGIVSLVREYLVKNKNISNPSSALIKAMLINGAKDITGTVPDMNQGWGFVDLNKTIYEDELYSLELVEVSSGLSTSEEYSYNFSIFKSINPLKISVVWTDYPGTATGSGAELVNDLDVILFSPNGTQYYGNDFTAPFNDSKDSLNNVEGIRIDSPEVGDYILKVKGFNIAVGTQPFSFVVSRDNYTDLVIENITPLFNDIVYSDNLSFNLKINFSKNITYISYFNGTSNINLSNNIISNNSVDMIFNVTNFGNQSILFNFTDYQGIDSSYILNFTLIQNIIYNLSYPVSNSTLNLSKLSFFINLSFSKNISSLYYIIDNYTFNITDLINNSGEIKILNNLDIIDYGLFNVTFFYVDLDSISGNFTVILNFSSNLRKNLTDYDEDGFNNSVDKLIGNISNVNSNYGNLNITINSSINLNQLFNDNLEFVILNSSDKIIEFSNNFSNNSIDLSKLVVKQKVDSSNKSKFFVNGINLEDGKTKTVYFKLNGNISKSNSLCLKDTIVYSFDDITSACNGDNETFIDSVPVSVNGYNLSYFDFETIKITGLTHSGVSQMCTEDWSYSSWSSCSSSSQSRTAVDSNSCGTTFTRDILVQSCVMPSSGSSGGGGGGGSSSSGSISSSVVEEIVEKNSLINDKSKSFYFKVAEEDISSDSGFSKIENIGIYEFDLKLVSFDFDFSSGDLDLSSINIKYDFNEQSSVVLTGFSELDIVKLVYLKNNLNLNYVCIKDDEILSIDEISNNCLDYNEIFLKCDGVSVSGLSCSLVGEFYEISGLTKSAVLEVDSKMISVNLFGENITSNNRDIGRNKILDVESDFNESYDKIVVSVNNTINNDLELPNESDFKKYLMVVLIFISFILISKMFIFKHNIKKN